MRSTGTAAENRIARDEAHVWFARPEAFAGAALDALLSPDERARQARFHFQEDRDLYLVAHALLRSTLARALDCQPAALRFRPGLHGKPELAWPEPGSLQFNLSHTPGLAACVLTAAGPAGIDVEDRRRVRDVLAVAARCFSPTEAADVRGRSGADQRDRFLAYWTLKEAYLKARGVGLGLPLDRFSMTLADADTATVRFDPTLGDDPAGWQLIRLALTGAHVGALALATGRPVRVIVREAATLP